MKTFEEQQTIDMGIMFKPGTPGSISAIYATGDEEPRSITVFISYGEELAAYSAASSQAAFAVMVASRADLPSPKRYDKFTVDSVAWQMESIIQKNPGAITLRLTTDQRMG